MKKCDCQERLSLKKHNIFIVKLSFPTFFLLGVEVYPHGREMSVSSN